MRAAKEGPAAAASESPGLARIRNVWKYNVEHEFGKISRLLEEGYCFVAMDTEFPGIVFTYGADKGAENGYRMLKQNVDALRLIQMGVTLTDARGQKPAGVHTWQFNLRFNVAEDRHNADSIGLLREAGINFDELNEHGIDAMVFGDLLMTSGLIVNGEITWVTFHGTYDFAYVVKALLNEPLPHTSEDFTRYLKHCFPRLYDIKTIVNDIDEWKMKSLSKLGEELALRREGCMHQAGSDALLTMDVFFALSTNHFPGSVPSRYLNRVFGFHNEGPMPSYPADMHGYPAMPYAYASPFAPIAYYMHENFSLEGFYPSVVTRGGSFLAGRTQPGLGGRM